ncbi:hypothetical protein LTR36_009518 [Oleoguttula mirabilis]|uniref:Uncharacterized protein n=1 Tax=Oleoguttula mirabilis TaxID=1507867 RepID=A0AAV9JSZ6_9PEZI|nr:hypothetical protein LTR36_009518 [Oleoguttula mirabilis]
MSESQSRQPGNRNPSEGDVLSQKAHKRQRRPRHKHLHAEPHPDTPNIHTPSDFGQGTSADKDATGSPKVTFSPELPTRMASRQLSQSLNFHAEPDEDLDIEERAILRRRMDVERVLNSIRLLGYEVNHAPGETPSPDTQAVLGAHVTASGVLQGPTATFYHTGADPLQKLMGLIISMHQELDMLMPKLAPQTISNHDGTRWKEDMTLGLLTGISPALGRLSERVIGQAGGIVLQHQGGVRLFVGQGQQTGW